LQYQTKKMFQIHQKLLLLLILVGQIKLQLLLVLPTG